MTEQELIDAGYVLTPEVFHSGIGNGKVYAKSFDNVAPFDDKNIEGGKHYDHFSVDPEGVVATYPSVGVGIAETPVATPVVETPVEAAVVEKPEVAETTE